jgi:hypothetical protein
VQKVMPFVEERAFGSFDYFGADSELPYIIGDEKMKQGWGLRDCREPC